MSVNIVDVAPRHLSAVYDGTNGADLVDAILGAVFVSDTGTLLTFNIGNDQLTANVGDVAVWRQADNSASGVIVFTPSQYADLFAPL